MSSSRKRKHKASVKKWEKDNRDTYENVPEPDPALFIQAYEADIMRGPQAWQAALSLEASAKGHGSGTQGGLIQWNSGPKGFDLEEEAEPSDKVSELWVDRYDVRLLLDSLPNALASPEFDQLSSSGWSDLPSDSEDIFFLTKEEVDDYHRDKRRRLINQSHEERLRALWTEDGDAGEREEDKWGGSDEEPDEAQREFMRRTASQVLSSSNPAQLEMRILANHGADPRFAFLRGRWSRTWKIIKGRIRIDSEKEKAKKTQARGLGGLAAYGDSDGSDSENSEVEDVGIAAKASNEATKVEEEVKNPDHPLDDTVVKEARRARAREWAEKRRALLKSHVTDSS